MRMQSASRRRERWFSEPVVTFCVYGFHVGCQTAAALRKAGFDARYMSGGYYGWKAIKAPTRLAG
jgi:superoxide dismutase, Fe-Mn family